MTNPVTLNYETHQNTRVITSRGAKYGENTHIISVVANELNSLALEYPVFFTKNNETGQFELTAMFGFEPGENLFLQGEEWDASYVPMHILRQPFRVLFQSDSEGNNAKGNALVCLDMDSDRVQESAGEALFNKDGSKTTYLENITTLLSQLITATESTQSFIKTIADLELLEAASLKVTLQGKEKTFEGLYTINEEKLNQLTGDAFQDMHKKNYLQASYLQIASIGNIKKLIHRKNRLSEKR